MSQKSKNAVLALSIIAVIVGLGIMIAVAQIHETGNIYIFADISECAEIENLCSERGTFTKYQNTQHDDSLHDLSYSSFFAGKFTCSQFNFEIFAYEFNDVSSAKTYFENITGKNSEQKSSNFSISSGALKSHIVVFNETEAYAAYFPTNNLSDVMKILEEVFTVKIK